MNRIKIFFNQDNPDLNALCRYAYETFGNAAFIPYAENSAKKLNIAEADGGSAVYTSFDLFRSPNLKNFPLQIQSHCESQDFLFPEDFKLINSSKKNKQFHNFEKTTGIKKEFLDKIISKDEAFDLLVGKSESLKKVKREIFQVKDKNCKVLFLGESGTGKSLAARVLKRSGHYQKERFVSVNVGTLQKELIETTLFGSVKGAYTDARDRKGLIAMAEGGLMFLDEIGELPLECQPQLLRALDEGVYRRVGSDKEEKLDVRFCFATNANLKNLVAKKQFREDLYWRIAECVIEIPPLRIRKDDILQLANSFLHELSTKNCGKNFSLTAAASEKLLSYDWPGNIRELRTCLNISTIYAESGVIDASDLRFN